MSLKDLQQQKDNLFTKKHLMMVPWSDVTEDVDDGAVRVE